MEVTTQKLTFFFLRLKSNYLHKSYNYHLILHFVNLQVGLPNVQYLAIYHCLAAWFVIGRFILYYFLFKRRILYCLFLFSLLVGFLYIVHNISELMVYNLTPWVHTAVITLPILVCSKDKRNKEFSSFSLPSTIFIFWFSG